MDATPNDRGFFQLAGIAPGEMTVTVTRAGYLPAKISPVHVPEGGEIELDDVVLRRPVELERRFRPAMDLSGKPWDLILIDFSGGEAPRLGTTDAEGTWKVPDLAPGQYVLLVADGQGTRMAEREIWLAPGETVQDVELDVVFVEGDVTLGDQPLVGRVVFGGTSGSVSVAMESDAEGRFAGVVSRTGSWRVDVTAKDPRVFRRFRDIEVEPNPASGVARVEL